MSTGRRSSAAGQDAGLFGFACEVPEAGDGVCGSPSHDIIVGGKITHERAHEQCTLAEKQKQIIPFPM